MVAPLNHSGLLRLYYDIPGAPWKWSRWKEITGVKHGLFPNDDAELPPGWTRDMARAIHSYFEAYRALPSEESKHAFSSGKDQTGDSSGRAQWRSWVVQNWGRWKIQLKIHGAFEDSGCLWHQIMVADGLAEFPKELPLNDASDRIAYTLFGSDGLNMNGKTLYALRKTVHIFATVAAGNFRRSGLRLIARVKRDEAAIDAVFHELEKRTPTKQKLASLVKMVANWRKDIMIWNSEENLLKLAYIDLELADIRKALGGVAEDDPFNPVLVKKRAARIKPKVVQALAKREDVQDILALFDSHLSPDEQLPEICITSSIPFAEPVEGADPGVEVEAGMSYEQLCTNLLLDKSGRLVLFNDHRHVGRVTAWSASGAKVFHAFLQEKENAHLFKPIQMHWHQLAGAHAVLRKFFTQKRSTSNVLGMLIADDVGLGKSFLAALVAAFLIELGMRQKKGSDIPPLIMEKIPDHPTLIVVPGTLQRQWLAELQTLMRLHSVDLFCYPSSKVARDRFWADDSPYNTTPHAQRNRIIIASHSTLVQEYRLLWESESKAPASERLPFDHPPERLGAEDRRPKTLYGRKYLTIIFDEAQAARNYGSTHSSALLIFRKAHTRLILTATPLQTRVEDIAAIGRMVGIPHFRSQVYLDELAQDATAVRKAKQDLGAGDSDESAINPVVALQIEASKRMQGQFMGRLIRRKATSVDYEQNPLLVLPPCDVVDVIVQLQPWELEFVDNSIPDEAIDRLSQATALGIATETFWSNERMAVTFPRQDTNAPIPRIKTLRQWNESKTTKVLSVHKVSALAINGSMTYDQRAKTVEKFKKNSSDRVLIISKVGSVGLNLTEADTIIFLDQEWSYADDNQATGRIHRQGQTQPVVAYHILASGTVDYYIASVARGKAVVSEAFLSSRQQQLADILAGNDVNLGDDEDGGEKESKGKGSDRTKEHPAAKQSVEVGPSKKRGKRQDPKAKNQRIKSKPIVIEEDEDSDQAPAAGHQEGLSNIEMHGVAPVPDQEAISDIEMEGVPSASDREGCSDVESFGPPSTRAASDYEDIDDDFLPPTNQGYSATQPSESLKSSDRRSPVQYLSSDEDEPDFHIFLNCSHSTTSIRLSYSSISRPTTTRKIIAPIVHFQYAGSS
ncbi:hypothetical protein EST38_g8476 [Candolleomyces aberdarensis]|uniref:Uncharacterized protein n=1 Tax=Candolleomyces aberdarensis TaxID=2316362 RepID=A0A4Q2DEH9_9AGAR|nr:hypothetical protein EST38_g8476 [Candolleomyces aberdarensis]